MVETVRVVGFDADITPLIQKSERLIKQLGLVSTEIGKLGQEKTADAFADSLSRMESNAAALQQRVAAVLALQRALNEAGKQERPRLPADFPAIQREAPRQAAQEKLVGIEERLGQLANQRLVIEQRQQQVAAQQEAAAKRSIAVERALEAAIKRQEVAKQRQIKAQDRLRELTAQQRSLESQVGTARNQKSDPAKRVEAAKRELDLVKQLEAIRAARDKAQRTVDTTRTRASDAGGERGAAEKELASLKQQGIDLDKQALSLQRELTAAQRERTSLEERAQKLRATVEDPGQFGPRDRPRTTQVAEELRAQGAALEAERLGFSRQILEVEQNISALQKQYPQVFRQILGIAENTEYVAQRIQRILSGSDATDLVSGYLRALEEQQRVLQRNKALVLDQVRADRGRAGDRLEKDRTAELARQTAARRELVRLRRQEDALDEQAAGTGKADTAELQRIQAARADLVRQRGEAIQAEESATRRLSDLDRQRTEGVRQAGGGALLDSIDRSLEENQTAYLDVVRDGIDAVIPGYTAIADRVRQINDQIASGNLSEQERNAKIQQRAALLREIESLGRDAVDNIRAQALAEDDAREARIAGMPLLERSLVGAFDDMFRRFQATLQFAISGALIFGVQQFARKFLETAIEVERAFADIATAFAFDVSFSEGSREFNIEVQKIRLSTLALADEFNTLPTEANAAAFSMVARFGDVDKALAATRAQLLAVKVSGIDQTESLRALSAAAENFAAANLFVNDSLSIQEKLMRREAAAVQNYGKALDIAVLIQQQFGVETEDTLEGVARLSPAFSQLGFSMEQTAAIVAAVSRELGQTGQNVAERLNRALGQLTEPSIRDGLLGLAAANENLNLTFADFENGPRALQALIKGYDDLIAAGDSGAAYQLLNEIGQRRELEVVAALFNTTDLRDSIEESLDGAAGSAERRFGALDQTISETLLSIGGGFERLAQNVQRLGVLDPFRVMLITLDKVLSGINQLLELIDTTITSMGALGTVLKTVVGFGLTAKGVSRLAGGVIGAIAQGGSRIAAGAGVAAGLVPAGADAAQLVLLSRRAEEVTSRFAALKAGTQGGRLSILAMGAAAKSAALSLASIPAAAANNFLTGLLQRIAPGVSRFAPTLGARLAGSTTLASGAVAPNASIFASALLTAGTAAVALGVTFIQLRDSFENSSEALRLLANLDADVEGQVRQERRSGLITSDGQERVREAEIRLSEIQERSAESTADVWATSFRNVFTSLTSPAILFDSDTRNRLTSTLTNPEEREAFARRNDLNSVGQYTALFLPGNARREIIAGSEEFWRKITLEQQQQVLQARIAEAESSLFASAPDPGVTGRRARTPLNEESAAFQRASDAVAEARTAAADAFTEEELANAETMLTDALAAMEEFFVAAGISVTGFEGTVASINATINKAFRDFSLGKASREDVDAVLAEQQQSLLALAASLEQSGQGDAQEKANEAMAAAAEIQRQRIDRQLEAFGRERTSANNLPDQTNRLVAALQIQMRELEYLRAYGSEDEIDGALQEIADLQNEIAALTDERAITTARNRLDLARTSADWFAASQQLTSELRRQAAEQRISGDRDRSADLLNQARQQELAEADRALDETKRRAVARARLSGPINSRLSQIEGEISATKIELGSALDPLQILELTVQLRELVAQRAQEQLNRLGAYVAAQAGVNDSLLALKGQLVHANAEMELASKQFGETSAEFYNADLRIQQLKNELANTMLELEDLNRRLGSDLSDDFDQAQFDLIAIMQRLKAPDLGPLEEARLQLEKEKATLAAERAYFNDKLFDLEFLKETGALGSSAYVGALRALLGQVDTTTKQGKEIFLQIQGIIDGLTNDVSNLAFNLPTNIKLPTLFEVRRAVAADQLGVNYQDNRRQNITIDVRDATDLQTIVQAVVNAVGADVTSGSSRSAPGGASLITAGSGF